MTTYTAPLKDMQFLLHDVVVDVVTVSTFADESGTPTTRVEIQLTSMGRAEAHVGDDQ